MSRIKVMNQLLASRIAAGEVIERPASVVKELVENSIDAGASEITVEVERAGSRLIAVTDNGCGMDDEDALLALQQHGTSKLLNETDLDHIMTLGFRGEALPSIVSVSQFTLTTRQPENPGGIRVECDEHGSISTRPHGGAPGTRIEVRNLFCNLPARKKFLKSAATEEHHIEEIFAMMAIAHPEISFRLLLDGRTALFTPKTERTDFRLREIFGKTFVDNMLFFEHTEGDLHISGCVAAPGFTRPSRRDQRVFINSRPVEAQAVYRGIKEGYSTLAEPGRYNPVVMFLEMPPGDLDVNVHPAKREVRFKAEYVISRAVSAAVSAALRQTRTRENPPQNDAMLTLSGKLPLSMVLDSAAISYSPESSVQPELPVEPVQSIADVVLPLPEKPEKTLFSHPGLPPSPEVPEKIPEKSIFLPTEIPAVTGSGKPPAIQKETVATPEKSVVSCLVKAVVPAAFSGIWPHRIIGVIDHTYILAESTCGLVLIDQHAAHERIMFEKILDQYSNGSAERQQLLIPETLDLSRSMIKLLDGNRELFEKLGFEVESAGGTTVLVNSIPLTPCSHQSVEKWLHDMLNELLDSGIPASAIPPETIARAACKAAVKAHDELPLSAMESLLEQLKNCRQGTLCPHGRPTMIEVSLRELERRFGRK
ncbi:MAG: DNA mismatch repair endonuclease MutL [Lentisphaerae bacterium]|nr:DNA mismatch repair endonuclease MutL [Lentisphaerota bacterium]